MQSNIIQNTNESKYVVIICNHFDFYAKSYITVMTRCFLIVLLATLELGKANVLERSAVRQHHRVQARLPVLTC